MCTYQHNRQMLFPLSLHSNPPNLNLLMRPLHLSGRAGFLLFTNYLINETYVFFSKVRDGIFFMWTASKRAYNNEKHGQLFFHLQLNVASPIAMIGAEHIRTALYSGVYFYNTLLSPTSICSSLLVVWCVEEYCPFDVFEKSCCAGA
jgi:hypothetical protein